MADRNDVEVLIAGAGPAGLGVALFLDEQGVVVEILDPKERPDDGEVGIALRRNTVAWLAACGVTFDTTSEARVIDSVAVYEGPGRRSAELLDPREAAGIVVPRYLLCKKLHEELHGRDVPVRWNHRLARVDLIDRRLEIDIDGLGIDSAGYAIAVHERIVETTSKRHPPYLIAADGAESVVRQQMRIPWRPIGEPQRIVSFELVTAEDAGGNARIIVGDATVELWPLPGNAMEMIVIEPRLPIHDPPDLEDVHALLDAHAPGHAPPIRGVLGAHVKRIVPGFAEPSHVGPIWLLGSAARVLPAPAYSIDQTLREGHRLARAFGEALRTLEPPERIVGRPQPSGP
jgi:2-polyprenyl-6-methoxyphenol hydroxylase-like FAD-dependent oxidoreductase